MLRVRDEFQTLVRTEKSVHWLVAVLAFRVRRFDRQSSQVAILLRSGIRWFALGFASEGGSFDLGCLVLSLALEWQL